MSRIRIVQQEKNRQKVKNIYVKKKRRRRDTVKAEVPVDSRTIDKKLSLRDSAKESNKRISATLEEFEAFCKKDKHYLKNGRIGDSYQRGQEAFKDTQFLFVEVDRVQDENMEQLEDVTKWFGENVADMEIMESEFIEAEDESKDTKDLLEKSDRIKKEYMYIAGESKRKMHKLFTKVKVAAHNEVKQAIHSAAEHRAQIKKHKKDKRRLLLMSALQHHRAEKAGKGENQVIIEETPVQLPNVLTASKPATPENDVLPKEANANRPGQEGSALSIDADGNYVAQPTEQEESVILDENVEDEVREDEDDEDEFAETLEQLKRLQNEVEDLKKKRQEDVAALRLAETKRDTTLENFEKYKVMSAEKELLMTRKINRLEEQLVRESSRAREKELEERAKFEQEQFVAKSANRKGAKVAEIKEKKLRDEIHALQDQIAKLEHVVDDQNLELVDLRAEVAKPKIDPEEYERVKALQQEADDALYVMKNELAQQQFEAQQTLEKFQKEAAEEREKLEKQLVSAKKDIEDAKRVAAKNLERAKMAEDEIQRLQVIILELEQKIVEIQEEMIQKIAEERERGERLLAEQVELTKAAEAEVERLEKEIQEIEERHAKEIETLQKVIDKQTEEIDRLNLKIDSTLMPTINDLIEIGINASKTSGSDILKDVILQHFQADRLKRYIEVGINDPEEKDILDSAHLDASSNLFQLLNVATDMTTANKSDVEAFAECAVVRDKVKKQVDIVQQIENTKAAQDGLTSIPESSQSLSRELNEANERLFLLTKTIGLQAEIQEEEIDNMQANFQFTDEIHQWKIERAEKRVNKRDADRRDKEFRTNRLINKVKEDRKNAYAEQDVLIRHLYDSSMLLGRLMHYLETQWDDERDDADELISTIFNNSGRKFIHVLFGNLVDISNPKLKRDDANALFTTFLEHKQLLRNIKLSSIDESFSKSINVEDTKKRVEFLENKIQNFQSSLIGDSEFSGESYSDLMTEINTIRKKVYLNIENEDEADIMMLKNRIKEQQKNFDTNNSRRKKRSKDKTSERNSAIQRKTGKLMKQIELLEIAVQRRDRSATNLLEELRVTYDALYSYACICEKLKIHAGSHGQVYNRNDLVKAAHSLEEKSAVLLNILGPSVNLSIVKEKFMTDMLSKRSNLRSLLWKCEFEADDVEKFKLKQQISSIISDIKKQKRDCASLASLREIGKHDEDNHFKDFTSRVDEHLQLEMAMAMLNLEQLMLLDGEEFEKAQEKIELHKKMVQLQSILVLKKQELHTIRFDFEDEESKKPTPLQLENRALKSNVKNLEAAKEGLQKAVDNFNVQVETLNKTLSEAMQELELLKANNIDKVLADLRAERFGVANLLRDLESAAQHLSHSAVDKKPKRLSAKALKMVKCLQAQTYPSENELPDALQSFANKSLRSKDVISVLHKGAQCLQSLLKLEFGGEGPSSGTAGPSKSLKGSLRVARIGGNGRSKPGANTKIGAKNMGAVYSIRQKLAEKNREMAILREELESQYQQNHGYGELEYTEKRMRTDKSLKQRMVSNTLHSMKNGLMLNRITNRLDQIGTDDPENKEAKALLHNQSKLEAMNEKLDEDSELIEKRRQKNLLFALSALERVQLAAENIIGEMPSNEVIEEIFKAREEIKLRLNLGGMNDRLPVISGHGFPHLIPKEKTETRKSPKKRSRIFSPKKTPFGSSAARKSQFDNSMAKAKIIDGKAYNEGYSNLFIGDVNTTGFTKYIAKSKSMVQLRSGISPIAQRVASPNSPPWFPSKYKLPEE